MRYYTRDMFTGIYNVSGVRDIAKLRKEPFDVMMEKYDEFFNLEKLKMTEDL